MDSRGLVMAYLWATRVRGPAPVTEPRQMNAARLVNGRPPSRECALTTGKRIGAVRKQHLKLLAGI